MIILQKGSWEPVGNHGVTRRRRIKYRARFWFGDEGRYQERDCDDILREMKDGRRLFLNTAKNVSYYNDLLREAMK